MFFLKIILTLFAISRIDVVRTENDLNFIHQVMIVALDGYESDHCGGALVAYSWAVTSLKCAKDLFTKFKDIKVIAGFNEIQQKYKEIRIATKYVTHEENDELHDIALVQVSEPFTKTTELHLARLPDEGEEICENAVTMSIFPEIEDTNAVNSRWGWADTKKKLGSIFLPNAAMQAAYATQQKAMDLKNMAWNTYNKTIEGIKQKKQDLSDKAQQAAIRKIEEQAEKLKEKLTAQAEELSEKAARQMVEKAIIFDTQTIVNQIRHWFQGSPKGKKRDSEVEASIFTGTMKKGPRQTCAGSKGWPLFCGCTIFGMQKDCQKSGARAGDNVANYVGLYSMVDFIAETTGIKTRSGIKRKKNGANSLHTQSIWKQVLVGVIITQIFQIIIGGIW